MSVEIFDGDDLVAMLDALLDSMIEALQLNDWVEAGRLHAALASIASSLGVTSFLQPFLSTTDVYYVPLLSGPSDASVITLLK